MKTEIWKDVVGYEGWYSVSNMGRVRRDKVYQYSRAGKIIKHNRASLYPAVSLSKNNKVTTKRVHAIVARAFLGERSEGMEVNHIDSKKRNPELSNLEYVTKSENAIHAFQNGTRAIGSKHCQSKLLEKDIIKIRKLYVPYKNSQYKLAKQFNISRGSISSILSGRTWRHI